MNKQEAAEYLGVSVRTLQRLTSAGRIAPEPKRRPSDETQYSREELDRYKREEEAAPKYVRPAVTHDAPGALALVPQDRSQALAQLVSMLEEARASARPQATITDLAHKLRSGR